MASKAYHKGKYFITFKRGYEDCRRDVTLCIDKVFENDTLRISLSDEDDPIFLYILNVTRLDYEDLKKHQGLLVDFENFPSQLVRLLQQCASNNMFLILQQSSPLQFYLEVVEHNEFKRLVHLSLKTSPATDSQLKQHMADNIKNLKKTLSSVKSSAMSNEALLNDKCFNMERKIHDLSHALSKLEEEKLKCEIEFKDRLKQEQDRIMEEKLNWQKNMDYNMKTKFATYQDNMDRKDKQIDELNSLCKQLRDNIMHLENQLSEKSKCLSLLEKEVQKSHIEVATLKAKNATLEKDVMERDKEYNHLNSKYMYLEKTVKDNSDVIKDLNNTLQTIKKEKANLEERLAISESLANKNNEAVHSTSEQLLKANQIISKQNADLIEMKEKLLCRTAIALEQEKVIERNTKEMDELKLKMSDTDDNMDKLQKKFDDLMEKYENIEKTLKEREETIKNNNMVIQWLHKKMERSPSTETTINTHHKNGIQNSSSTPYFISRKNNYQEDSSHVISDESIDFYATSKSRSNLEESPGPEGLNKVKLGLDPKYLQPADSDNKVASATGTKLKPNNVSSSKGKENFNTNLPKVDYREKKSARASYRATPVSAYFP